MTPTYLPHRLRNTARHLLHTAAGDVLLEAAERISGMYELLVTLQHDIDVVQCQMPDGELRNSLLLMIGRIEKEVKTCE